MIRYVTDVLYENYEMEKARRVHEYSRQCEALGLILECNPNLRQGTKAVPVICEELDREWSSPRAIAVEFDVNVELVRMAVRTGCPCGVWIDGEKRRVKFRRKTW